MTFFLLYAPSVRSGDRQPAGDAGTLQ